MLLAAFFIESCKYKNKLIRLNKVCFCFFQIHPFFKALYVAVVLFFTKEAHVTVSVNRLWFGLTLKTYENNKHMS
jgi:hypothetical protein